MCVSGWSPEARDAQFHGSTIQRFIGKDKTIVLFRVPREAEHNKLLDVGLGKLQCLQATLHLHISRWSLRLMTALT